MAASIRPVGAMQNLRFCSETISSCRRTKKGRR